MFAITWELGVLCGIFLFLFLFISFLSISGVLSCNLGHVILKPAYYNSSGFLWVVCGRLKEESRLHCYLSINSSIIFPLAGRRKVFLFRYLLASLETTGCCWWPVCLWKCRFLSCIDFSRLTRLNTSNALAV